MLLQRLYGVWRRSVSMRILPQHYNSLNSPTSHSLAAVKFTKTKEAGIVAPCSVWELYRPTVVLLYIYSLFRVLHAHFLRSAHKKNACKIPIIGEILLNNKLH